MITGWIVLGVVAVGAVVTLVTARVRRHQLPDLGTVSHQWIAEQRLGQGHDPQR